MSTTEEEQRHDLIEALRTVIGSTQTGTLMGYLPPVGWADVATKQDLAHQDALLRLEIGTLRTEMNAGFDALRNEFRGEISGVRTDMDNGFAAVRAEMGSEFAAVRSEMGALELRLEARMQEMFRKQTVMLVMLLTALMTAYAAAISVL